MSRLFPAPFRQFIRSAIRKESIGIPMDTEFLAEAEVFAQPLAAKNIDLLINHDFATPVGINKIVAAPVRSFFVDFTRDSLAAASMSCSGTATTITTTDKTAMMTSLAEVEQI
jgi:hypothetical protein